MEKKSLPNIRRIFAPDTGFFIFESDMSKADAQIVAWESNDTALKEIFRSGKNLHRENAISIFGDDSPLHYKLAKSGVHACNYGVTAKTLGSTLGLTTRAAQAFIDKWFLNHPGIKQWQEKVLQNIVTQGCCWNIYGYARTFFGRNRSKLNTALGWIGQSSVAINCINAMQALRVLEPKGVQILLQIHDSIVFQIRCEAYPDIIPEVYTALHQACPYSDKLIIPWSLKGSSISWGDCHEIDWNNPTTLEQL